MVEINALVPAFCAVKVGTFPVPIEVNPMPELLLDQEKVEPDGVLVKAVKGTVEPSQ